MNFQLICKSQDTYNRLLIDHNLGLSHPFHWHHTQPRLNCQNSRLDCHSVSMNQCTYPIQYIEILRFCKQYLHEILFKVTIWFYFKKCKIDKNITQQKTVLKMYFITRTSCSVGISHTIFVYAYSNGACQTVGSKRSTACSILVFIVIFEAENLVRFCVNLFIHSPKKIR